MEYQREMRIYGKPNYSRITKAVGLKSNVGTHAKRIIQKWLELEEAPKGQLRECLCCDAMFVSTGKNHRMCDKCRFNGEYAAPYSISPSILYVGRAF